MTDAETTEILEQLLASSRETALGFCGCAAEARTAELQVWLMDRADRYARAARELRDLLERLGCNVHDTTAGTPRWHGAAPHAAPRMSDETAMLAACERAEDATIVRYRDALECSLASTVRDVVARQFARLLDNRGVMHEVYGRLKRPPRHVSAPAIESQM